MPITATAEDSRVSRATTISAAQCTSAINFLLLTSGATAPPPSRYSHENIYFPRLDYHINNSNSLFVRYFRDQGNWDYPEGVTGRSVAVVDNPQNEHNDAVILTLCGGLIVIAIGY